LDIVKKHVKLGFVYGIVSVNYGVFKKLLQASTDKEAKAFPK